MTGPSPVTRLGALVDVTDAGRLLECHQIARQKRFQHLVRCYLSQILHGCKSAYCTTPTCLSCNKRLVTKPHRPPTQLTARALAFYLASQDNPRRGLCPHELKVDPDAFEIEAANGDGVPQDERDEGTGDTCRSPAPESVVGHADAVVDVDGRNGTASNAKAIAEAVAKRHQSKKDPKSLGQMLYDTATIIYSYSERIANPTSVFALLQSSNTPDQLESSTAEAAQAESTAAPASQRPRRHSHVAIRSQPNGDTVPATVNGNDPSLEAAQNTTNRISRLSPSADNGSMQSEVFRIRHILDSEHEQHSRKSKSISALDGNADSTKTVSSRMRTPAGAPGLFTPSEKGSINYSKNLEPSRLQVASHLTYDVVENLKEHVYHHRNKQPVGFNFAVDYDANRHYRPATPFANRSLFFNLSDPEALLKSFRDSNNEDFSNSPLPHLDSYRLTNAFRDWNQRNGALIFDSLCTSVDALFRPPPELNTQKSPRMKPSRKGATPPRSSSSDVPQEPAVRYLSDNEAAHIVVICIHALTSLVSNGWPHTWVQIRKFRGWGVILPSATPLKDVTDGFADPWLSIVDELEYEPAVRLASKLLRGIGARMCFEEVLSNLRVQSHDDTPADLKGEKSTTSGLLADILVRHLEETERNAISRKTKMRGTQSTSNDPGWTLTATFMEWLRTIIIKEWDGKSVIRKWTGVGAAFALLSHFHRRKDTLDLRPEMFHIPYLNERLDAVQVPIEFIGFQQSPNTAHILDFPYLFPQKYLIGYFRTVNFTAMLTQANHSWRTAHLQTHLIELYSQRYDRLLRNELKVSFTDYLFLQVRREDALKETLDQLWGQEKRMLLKPLKVRLGTLEGEVGFDQGGVTCEYFRIVLVEAFKVENGMFTIDSENRMTWFQPASFEPDWKFQMLGVLFSLAVYNGVTLPVTFPLTFYEQLLAKDPYSCSRDLTTDSIRDGWPTLAKSFDEFLSFEGEVADVYMRDYMFSFEAFGHNVDVDMQAFEGHKRWPARSSPPPPDRFENASAWRASLRASSSRPPLTDMAWTRPPPPTSGSEGEVEDPHSDEPFDQEPNLHPLRHSIKPNPTPSIDPVPEPEAPPVTNANRNQFVKDYLHWLTHRSIARQLAAFTTGFHTCLAPRSLSLFTPHSLRALIQGTPTISVPLLRKATRYESPYTATHPTILDFWSIVDEYSQAEVKRLLEFVTASERVPITGFEGMNFVIGPAEGGEGDTDLLPTSSTCFGKLYLPMYRGREKMGRKLGVALRNCEGFGMA